MVVIDNHQAIYCIPHLAIIINEKYECLSYQLFFVVLMVNFGRVEQSSLSLSTTQLQLQSQFKPCTLTIIASAIKGNHAVLLYNDRYVLMCSQLINFGAYADTSGFKQFLRMMLSPPKLPSSLRPPHLRSGLL